MRDYEDDYVEGSGGSILWAIALIIFIVAAGIPALAMVSETVACLIGAQEMWCPTSKVLTP